MIKTRVINTIETRSNALGTAVYIRRLDQAARGSRVIERWRPYLSVSPASVRRLAAVAGGRHA